MVLRDKFVPSVVISLDFELRWGWHDILGLDFDAHREDFEKEREVVPRLLELFEARDIRATWATVGALGCADWNEYFRRAPKAPQYKNRALAVRREYADLDPDGVLHFGEDLLRAILVTPGQDLGTHTFSHLYLREEGVSADDVAADLAAVSNLWSEKFDVAARSLVFPRNQHAYVNVARDAAIAIWRGNEVPWYYDCRDSRTDRLLPKALRFADGINPLCRLAAPLEADMTRASLYLRLKLPEPLWALHVRRIERELRLLKSDEVFHIWFHPLNAGQEMAVRLSRVEQVLDLIAEKQRRGTVASRSMTDLIAG